MDAQLKRGLTEACILKLLHPRRFLRVSAGARGRGGALHFGIHPVSRAAWRLETSGALRVYSIEHNGRLRKYYAITDEGRQKIQAFLQEWEAVMKVYEFIRRDEA